MTREELQPRLRVRRANRKRLREARWRLDAIRHERGRRRLQRGCWAALVKLYREGRFPPKDLPNLVIPRGLLRDLAAAATSRAAKSE